MNMRESIKRERLKKIGLIIEGIKNRGEIVDKRRLISMIIIEYGVSKKTATEELEAVMIYNE
jgi:hypothetical protein